ncbi:MAG: peptidylprolyl isomerase [Betaproteobacteria bacterium]|nr:MAG: peptidylprolyl isomerase [Betaproteobacteria bacterium]
MFDFITNHKRLIQIAFVLLIVPPFAFFGLESYTRSMRGADEIARVNDIPVSQREYEEARRAQLERLRKLFGNSVDAATLDTAEAQEAVLEALVSQRLVIAAALEAGLTVSDDALRQMILANPSFQRDGRFDVATYRQLLRAQGMSEPGYEQRMRQDVAVGQLLQAIGETAIASRAGTEQLAALEGQRREVAEALVPSQQFLAQVKTDEAQLKTYYEANSAQFRVPEQVKAEYLVLSAEELGRGDAVSEEELKAAYEARTKQYGVQEQRRASHILVKTRAEAEKLVAEARKAPARFAELAKTHSQDPGSAAAGGDLGLFGRGMMVKAFEDAAFGMKEGEIAGPVESEFGFHVIRLTAIQSGRSRSLDEVRRELATELARQKGAKRFAEAAEAFGHLVYEQSDSLAPAAQRFQLAIQQSDWLTRQPGRTAGPLDHPKVLSALFAQDSILARRNTDAIEVAPNVLVAARVTAHQPAAQRKFEEVRAQIEQRVQQQEAAKLAHREGAAKLAQLASQADAGLKWSAPLAVTVREPKGLSPEALRKVFAADAQKLPAHVGVERGEQGYAIYRVLRVIAAEPRSDAQKAADRAGAARRAGAEQFEAWLAGQRARAKVEINRANLERK